MTALMCRARPGFACQTRYGDWATALPRPVSQTNEGASTASCPEATQRALFQRSRSDRAVCRLRPIRRAICGKVTEGAARESGSTPSGRMVERERGCTTGRLGCRAAPQRCGRGCQPDCVAALRATGAFDSERATAARNRLLMRDKVQNPGF